MEKRITEYTHSFFTEFIVYQSVYGYIYLDIDFLYHFI